MRKVHHVVSAAAFLILILFVLVSVAILTGNLNEEDVTTVNGYADLSQSDFSDRLFYIPYDSFLYYDKALYTPDDFYSENVNTQPIVLNDVDSYSMGEYGTCRIILKLPQVGATYGLSSYSTMYAQRLFINGKEYPAVGVVGDTVEKTVPKTMHYTFYFTPDTENVEIIIQFSNFVHSDNGGIMSMYFGSSAMITARDAMAQQRINFLAGCSITVFLFFAGMFFFFRTRHSFMWFALICLSSGIRLLIMDEKVIMILFPNLNWYVSLGMEYIALITLILSIFLFLHNVFEGAIWKYVLWAFAGICAIFAAIIVFTLPIIYTRFIFWFEVCAAATGVYTICALIWNIARKKDNRYPEHVLILTSMLIYAALSIIDIRVFGSHVNHSTALGLHDISMIVLIFINMIALVLKFFRTETALSDSLRMEKEMQETNLFLDRMSRLKSDFLANISHEMRTPLTVMSSYAGLTSMEIRRGAVNERTLDNLDVIKREAIRLADLVEQIKEVAREREHRIMQTDTKASDILYRTAEFCGPICLKNNNEIRVSAEPDDISLCVDPESIFQTLVNLIINADRHTKGGMIRLNVKVDEDTDFAVVSVADSGNGIDPALLPDIFQRGVSGDGGTGLGLPICKEIVEEHGGKIWIKSEKGKGTTVWLTLPVSKEKYV